MTVGVSEALDIALRAFINPGDEILYHEPCYVSYHPMVVLAHGVGVRRPGRGRRLERTEICLSRPRDRNSPLFETTKRRILTALDRSLDHAAPDPAAAAETGDALWW